MTSTSSESSGHGHRSGGAGSNARPGVSSSVPPWNSTSPRDRVLLTVGFIAPSSTAMVLNLTDPPLGVSVPCFLAAVALGFLTYRRVPKKPQEAQHWRLTPRRWRFGPDEWRFGPRRWRLGLPSRATLRPRTPGSGTPPRGQR
ncbi:hypothetical protein [Actinopolyspora saharensis]|uniref:hypothetical protein n=1 Tax=Actinopolyspora saharensis TaxID=995062 RepID=UPI003F67064E